MYAPRVTTGRTRPPASATLIALSAVAALTTANAAAQGPRVILVDGYTDYARPRTIEDWVVTPADACPGATLLRACGGTPAAGGACPDVQTAVSALGPSGLDRCSATAELLAPAGALYDLGSAQGLAHAQRLYTALARVTALRPVALYRAARSAQRQLDYAAASTLYAELLEARPAAALREAVASHFALMLADVDADADGVEDPGFVPARLALLPDAAWSREMALRWMRLISGTGMVERGRELGAAIRARWPDALTEDVDVLEAEIYRLAEEEDALVEHTLASASRCRARHVACDAGFLDRAQVVAVARLGQCGAPPATSDLAARLATCLSGVTLGQRLLSQRPSETLALDVADAAAWVGPALARIAAASAASARDPALRAAAQAHLAAPLPDDPAPLRTQVAATQVDPTSDDGSVDEHAVRRAVSADALAACMPPRVQVLGVHATVSESGRLVSITTTGASGRCATEALSAASVPPAEGGAAPFDAIVLFAPAAARARRDAVVSP